MREGHRLHRWWKTQRCPARADPLWPSEASTDEPREAVRGLPAIHPVGHTVHQEPRKPCKESESVYTPSIICKLTVLDYWGFFPINFYWSIVGLQCHVGSCCTQSETVICTHAHIYTLFFLRLFSRNGQYRGLRRGLCVPSRFLLDYCFLSKEGRSVADDEIVLICKGLSGCFLSLSIFSNHGQRKHTITTGAYQVFLVKGRL